LITCPETVLGIVEAAETEDADKEEVVPEVLPS
jgi:hypothetical protein